MLTEQIQSFIKQI